MSAVVTSTHAVDNDYDSVKEHLRIEFSTRGALRKGIIKKKTNVSLRSVFINWSIFSLKINFSYIVVTILASKRILEDRQILLTGISSLLVTVIFIAVALSLSYFGQPTLPYIVCFAIFFFCAS